MRSWRPGRRAAIAALAICPLAGAALALALGPQADRDERAQALVLIGASQSSLSQSPGARAALTRTAAAIAGSAQTGALARVVTSSGRGLRGVRGQQPVPVHVETDPAAGVIRVSAQGANPDLAVARTDAAALQTATLTRGLVLASNAGVGIPVGDFEDSEEGWQGQGFFNNPPSRSNLTRTTAKFNRGSLEARCPARPSGCGPSVPLFYLFRAGVTYTGVLWARATTPGARAVSVLGSAADDVSQSPLRSLTPAWRRFVVKWSPRQTTGEAELALQVRSRRAVTIGVDGAALLDPLLPRASQGAFTEARERKTFTGMSYVGVTPARPIGVDSSTAPTILRALAGAAVGLLVSLAAIAAAWIARRRGQRQP